MAMLVPPASNAHAPADTLGAFGVSSGTGFAGITIPEALRVVCSTLHSTLQLPAVKNLRVDFRIWLASGGAVRLICQ